MKDYTLPTSTLLKQKKQCRNNRRLKNNLYIFINVVKRGWRTKLKIKLSSRFDSFYQEIEQLKIIFKKKLYVPRQAQHE